MPTPRLFVALPLPEPVRALLASLAAPLPNVRWTPPDQLHVTMRFLGETDSSRIEPLLEHLSRIQVEPFLLPVEGVGAFPPKRPPRVLWAGTGNGHPRLHQLRKQIDEALLSANVDFDLRTFHPHITLARCGEDAPAAAHWLHTHRDFEGPPFRVDAFDLVSSELTPAGALHHVIERLPIAAASSA